jgi:hypothetical protein
MPEKKYIPQKPIIKTGNMPSKGINQLKLIPIEAPSE